MHPTAVSGVSWDVCTGLTLEHASSGTYTSGVRKINDAGKGDDTVLVYELRADLDAVVDC